MAIIGVDVGGSFTDLVFVDPESGAVTIGKVPSTPEDTAEGVVRGLRELQTDLTKVANLCHGTTVATNAVIEGKGARTAGLFTKGFRDVIAIGTGRRFVGGLFDPKFHRTKPLIPRLLRFEVSERIDNQGHVLQSLEEASLAEVGVRLRDEKVEAVAICFLHSYANKTNEVVAEDYLRRTLPGVFICRSEDVLPQIREYERFTATAINASVGPVMARYLSVLESRLERVGFGGNLLIMVSNGGVVSAQSATRYPVTTVLSGPAGGVSGGVFLGRELGIPNLITYDMGGTSTDVCLIKDLCPASVDHRIVAGGPLRLPQLDINTIGAGGGSICWIDREGGIHVGPQSTGARPGPACYGFGGKSATVTDANLILARIRPDALLGGRMHLLPEPAHAVIKEITERLELADVYCAAEGIIRIAVQNMADAIRTVSLERGEDPRRFTLIAFGGAGPMHACAVAQELGISRIAVPAHPGNFSAVGMCASNLRHEFVRSCLAPLQAADLHAIADLLNQVAEEGHHILESEDVRESEREVRCFLGLQYRGQSHTLEIEADPQKLRLEDLEQKFRELYHETWSYQLPGIPVQLVYLRAIACSRAETIKFPAVIKSGSKHESVRRAVYFSGQFHETEVHQRPELAPGLSLWGPAIVEEEGSTTVIPPDWRAAVHPSGCIFLEPR